MRTASDLFIGAHFREEDSDETLLVDYLYIDDDETVTIEGYEVDSGQEFSRVYDPDDEINIVKGE